MFLRARLRGKDERFSFFKTFCSIPFLYHDPFAPETLICRKTRFEASRAVFRPLSCYKELKLTTKLFKGRTLRGLLIQMQNLARALENFRKLFSRPY